MSAIQLHKSQADFLVKELLRSTDLNVVRVTQRLAYGRIVIEIWSPEGKKETTTT